MPLIYHYTRFETFMSYILPSGFIRTNSLRHMNDPRESLDWSFGGTNVPYELIFEDYYSDKTHIDCMYKFGDMIKDRFQVICFSGARGQGWNNEMMWAHYGGLHSGICLEFDEDILIRNIKEKYSETDFKLEEIDYNDHAKDPWLNWERNSSFEENMEINIRNIYKKTTVTKSTFWEKEDEKRLVFLNSINPNCIPINGALKTVYVGVKLNKKELLPMVYNALDKRFNLSMLIYQNNKFERWGVKENNVGGIMTCDFEDI